LYDLIRDAWESREADALNPWKMGLNYNSPPDGIQLKLLDRNFVEGLRRITQHELLKTPPHPVCSSLSSFPTAGHVQLCTVRVPYSTGFVKGTLEI
jgi:hypothetical protein